MGQHNGQRRTTAERPAEKTNRQTSGGDSRRDKGEEEEEEEEGGEEEEKEEEEEEEVFVSLPPLSVEKPALEHVSADVSPRSVRSCWFSFRGEKWLRIKRKLPVDAVEPPTVEGLRPPIAAELVTGGGVVGAAFLRRAVPPGFRQDTSSRSRR